jgi:hypothetical protein
MKITDRIPTEHFEQCLLVQWFRRKWPDVRIFAIPNGGYRSRATAGRLKAEGVLSGVPDLFVPAWGLWIEMKRAKGGSLSAEQKDFIKYLESVGFSCIVGKGNQDAQEKITAFFTQNKGI